jgi:hypothetical protein
MEYLDVSYINWTLQLKDIAYTHYLGSPYDSYSRAGNV